MSLRCKINSLEVTKWDVYKSLSQKADCIRCAACCMRQKSDGFYTCTHTGGKNTQHATYRYTHKDKKKKHVVRVVLSLLPMGTQLCSR